MAMMLPLMIVNMKTYNYDLNEILKIANIAKKVMQETKTNIVLAPSHISLREVARIVPTFAQSIDPIEPGAHTGHVLASEVKGAGALGTLINHSEHRISMEDIKKCVEICRKVDIISCVCAANDEEAQAIAKFEPDMIATEPPDLIGGDVSVVTRPEIVKNSVMRVRKISQATRVLCGAGVKNGSDVKKARELGADGVLVASGVVKAKDIEKAMRDLTSGLR